MSSESECFDCALALSRKRLIKPRGGFGRKVMFVGEAPGEVEERIGKAFIGPSGKMLDRWIAELGLSEEDVYITNVVKCRPPKNRDPTPDEIESCLPQLAREIKELKPALVVPLGRFAKEVVSHMRETGDLAEENYGLGIKHPAWYLRKGGYPTAELDFIKKRLREKEKRNDDDTTNDEKGLTPSVPSKFKKNGDEKNGI